MGRVVGLWSGLAPWLQIIVGLVTACLCMFLAGLARAYQKVSESEALAPITPKLTLRTGEVIDIPPFDRVDYGDNATTLSYGQRIELITEYHPPPSDPSEHDKATDFHQRVAEDVVPRLSSASKTVLRYLWSHHTIVWASDLSIYSLPTDMVWKALTDELRRTDLVTQHVEPAAIGKNERIWWEITPGYKPALGNLLFF